MNLRTYSNIQFSVALTIVITTVVISWLYKEKSNDMMMLQQLRSEGYEFGQKFRNDSDKLTHLARTYVATGQQRFYAEYVRLLNIQKGEEARTIEGLNSLFIIEHQSYFEHIGKKLSTIDLIKLQNISEQEKSQLIQAIQVSNELANVEIEAFNLFKVNKSEKNALLMLFDDTYISYQQTIDSHIESYLLQQNARLLSQFRAGQQQITWYTWLLSISLVAWLSFLFFIKYYVKKNITKPLVLLSKESKDAKAHHYQKKVPAQSAIDDVNYLAINFNAMLDDINHNIGELNEQIENSSCLRKKAEIANRSKSNFLANMSHEIRTPLNGMVGLYHLLKETPLIREQEDYVDKSIESADSLLNIIDDILDFSKIEAGQFTIENQVTTIESIIEHVINLTAVSANEKGIVYLLNIAPDVPLEIETDRIRLLQILLNLVSNAIKFTQKGFVTLDISIDKTVEKPLLIFSVKDTGIGMTEPQLEQIFKPFQQADNSTTRMFGGTGLGLTISKKIAEMLGGNINVVSQAGLGSEFILTTACVPVNTKLMINKQVAEKVNVHFCFGSISKQSAINLLLKQIGATSTKVGLSQVLKVKTDDIVDFLLIDDDILIQISHEEIKGIKEKYRRIIAFPSAIKFSIDKNLKSNLVDKNVLWPVLPTKLIEYLDLNNYKQISSHNENADHWAQNNLSNVRILLAEDIKLNQIVVKKMINKLNGQVDIAENGIEVLALLNKNQYDVILMDLHMPEMDGYEATKRIRKHPEWSSLPIIGLSADAQSASKETCLEMGMNDYIVKPFDPRDLVKKVQQVTLSEIILAIEQSEL